MENFASWSFAYVFASWSECPAVAQQKEKKKKNFEGIWA